MFCLQKKTYMYSDRAFCCECAKHELDVKVVKEAAMSKVSLSSVSVGFYSKMKEFAHWRAKSRSLFRKDLMHRKAKKFTKDICLDRHSR